MLIPILKGTTEIIEKVKDGEIIDNGCPNCKNDLLLKQFRTWGTIFMIPVAPRKTTRFIYECIECRETFDPAYRNTFINLGKYRNATPNEIKELTNRLSLYILASVLMSDNRNPESIIDTLKDFAITCRINLETNSDIFSTSFLEQNNLTELVFEWYDIFRDCFNEEMKNMAMLKVLKYVSIIGLTEKEYKLLYTYSRHWGFTKAQYDDLIKSK